MSQAQYEPKEGLVIVSSHTTPVAVGTVVSFNAYLSRAGWTRNNEHADEFDFHWTIVGPFSNESRMVTTTRPTYDWDTEGLRPGAFTVSCSVSDRDGAPGTADGAAAVTVPSAVGGTTPSQVLGGAAVIDGGAGGGPRPGASADVSNELSLYLTPSGGVSSDGVVPVSLQRTAMIPTPDQALWVIIRNRTDAISFRNYRTFIDQVMGSAQAAGVQSRNGSAQPQIAYRGADAYLLLKYATNFFLMHEAGVVDFHRLADGNLPSAAILDGDVALADIEEAMSDPGQAEAFRLNEQRRLGFRVTAADIRRLRDSYYEQLKDESVTLLPYLRIIRERLSDIPIKPSLELPNASTYGILRSNLTGPLAMELIWSYWLEEGMLVQTLNAILARFQNRRLVTGADPLARFDLDPLRPLSNLFWGWVQDETNLLTVRRRAFEYDHEYGLRLIGRSIPDLPSADSRSKFLEAFHNLLLLCHVFFKEDDDTTVIADGFPVLNALRETHLLLAEGAHNQFGDLPSTARAEMLIMQWLLARPEMRDFLGGKIMVPYAEPWMDRVDSMKAMQGWTDVSITHFRDMGVFGEQILLSVRYGNWSTANDPQQAANWARYWRPEIQRYTHAYRSATGVDLTERVDATLPAVLLQRRLGGGRPPYRQPARVNGHAIPHPTGREPRRVQ